MPCRRKIEKTAALWWKSDLNRYRVDYEPISAPLFHHVSGLVSNPDNSSFLGFSSRHSCSRSFSFSWFLSRYSRLWYLFQPECSEKIIAGSLQFVNVSPRLTFFFLLHYFC